MYDSTRNISCQELKIKRAPDLAEAHGNNPNLVKAITKSEST